LERRTARTLTTWPALERELEVIRRQGYAVDDGEYHDGVRCLAAPVLDARGQVRAAIGITAAAARFTKRRIPAVAREVRQAADALSAALGRSPGSDGVPGRPGASGGPENPRGR
jgi:IclR family acetate operon transcriptional repressor